MPLPRHFVERTRAVSLLSSDSEDDASDSEPIGQFNLPPGSTARDLDFDFTGSQAFSRNTANPTTAADWTSYLSSIPYKADAPVGTRRRRLVRRRDVDLDGDDDNQSDHGDENIEDEVVDEDMIEADRRKIEDAADRLGCKRVIVKVTRREQVQADSMGEEVVGGRIQAEIDSRGHISRPSSDMMDTPTNETPGEGGSDKENLPQQKSLSTPTSVKKKPIIPEYNLADLDADDDELPDNIFGHIIPTAKRNGQKRTISATDLEASDEDEDFVLRKPGVPTSSKKSAAKRHAGGNDRALVPRVRAKMNDIDEMETIQGAQIGKIKDVRKFQDVVEEKVRWLVPGMRTPLFEHQVLGVDWMVHQELGDMPRGGLVMDAMGLGKTIQTIATMVLGTYSPDDLPEDRPPTSKVTLIVAPVALLPQWKEEIERHAIRGMFNVRVHHGDNKIKNLRELKECDVVVCSYNAIMTSIPSPKPPKGKTFRTRADREEWYEELYQQNRGMFHRIRFWRVVLDESHIIKNPASQTSMACQRLEAEYKWCLSGTPIINSLKDIYPVFSFIGHPKAGNPDGFRSLIDSDNAIRNGQRVQAVLRTCSMRRTKNDTLMGKPLIQLPKKRERLVELDFTPDERALYSSVEANSKAAINRALRRGSLAHGDFSAFLVLLLRLRQCCSHPWLILNSVAAQYAENELDSILQTTRQSGPIYRAIEAAAQSRADMPTGICQNCNTSTILVPTKCQHMEYCIDCITDVEECQTCRKPIKSDIESILPPLPDFIYSTKCRALADQIIVWRQELPGQKIIVFSLFTQLLDLLQAMIQSEPAFSDSLGFQRYQGSMTLDEREAALHNFRTDPNCTVLLTSMKAGGVGLNLTDGSLVVSMDLWWNRATEDQAFARVHRLGQTKEVEVVRLVVKDTVEQRILALQRDKMRVAGAALGEGDLRLGDNLSMRELLGLFGNVERDAMGRMQVV